MADLAKYPSPRKDDKAFTKYWDLYLPSIEDRDNLKAAHLMQLEILCDLTVEYYYLKSIIDTGGRTYQSEGRNGFQIKLNPEVPLFRAVITDIKNYSKMLGLVLFKDTKVKGKEKSNGFDDDDDE